MSSGRAQTALSVALSLDTVPWGAVGKINLREKHGLKGYIHPSVHCITVYNSQDMEAT